jgi:hypothetical protein
MTEPRATQPVVFGRLGLDRLVEVLIADDYQVIGPTVRDKAIVLAGLNSAAQLPVGWEWIQAPAIAGYGNARTLRCSRIRRGPGPGSSSCIHRGGSCGPRAWMVISGLRRADGAGLRAHTAVLGRHW